MALFYHLYESACLAEAVVCAGVQPSEAALQWQHLQSFIIKICLVYSGYFQLAASTWLYVLCHFHNTVGVEIEAHYGIVGFRLLWFLLNAQAFSAFVKFSHTISLRVVDVVAKDGGEIVSLRISHTFFQHSSEPASIENVVAEYKTHGILTDEFLSNDECLGKSVGRWLLSILKSHSQLAAVAEQPAESGKVVGSADDEYLPDARQHQHRDWIVNHRFVKDGNKLLTYSFGDGIQSCSATTCQYYTFHSSYICMFLSYFATKIINISH